MINPLIKEQKERKRKKTSTPSKVKSEDDLHKFNLTLPRSKSDNYLVMADATANHKENTNIHTCTK